MHGPESRTRLVGRALALALTGATSGGLVWFVWICASGLRDPRYLDGWVLAAGMALQLGFHIGLATGVLTARSAKHCRRFHICAGYVLIAAFISHSDLALPDTGFEWALWLGFVLVTMSGIWGTYLAWFVKARRPAGEDISYDRIPGLRAKIAHDVRAIVARNDPSMFRIALPGLPHDAWVAELYATRVRAFLEKPAHFSAHLVGSKRPLKKLTDEIDRLAAFVHPDDRQKLASIKSLVVEKDQLDSLQLYLGLNRVWQLVHVPVTYALIVLSIVHVLVVYAFSSGAW
ncbi:MAG: hypothetical protein R3D57_05485 [Hyphomicrobiaceae bacterium]